MRLCVSVVQLLGISGSLQRRSSNTALLRAAQSGRIGRTALETSYRRILRLKARL